MLNFASTNSILFSFLIIGTLNFLAVISPGPDFAMVVKTALTQPRKQAVFTALGIALGIFVHVTYCILGLALIITKSLLVFSLIKYCGAAYFVYLGIQGIRAKAPVEQINHQINTVEPISTVAALKRGFLCNVLNPKCTLFFLGLFTLVVKPTTPVYIQALYGVEMAMITFLWFSSLAVIITHDKVKAKIGRFQYIITKLMGVLLLLFGIELALLEHK